MAIKENSITVGSDVGHLSNYGTMSGIPRVVKSTHEYLDKNLDKNIYEFHGFIDILESINLYENVNSSFKSDPLLKKPILQLDQVDIALLIDLNWNFVFENLMLEKQRRQLTVISTVYDVLPLTHPNYFKEKFGASEYLKFFLKKLEASDHLIFNSKSSLEDFLSLDFKFAGSHHVFPLGAQSKLDYLRVKFQSLNTIIYVSTIEPRKGHMDVIDAFDQLIHEGQDIKLIFVGRHGWLCDDVINRIRSHQEFGKRFVWYDRISDDELKNVYNQATLAVVASHMEGFGLNLEEALSYKIPVVARNIPVFKERSYSNIHYFDDGIDNLTQTIKAAINIGWIENNEDLRMLSDFGADLLDLIYNSA